MSITSYILYIGVTILFIVAYLHDKNKAIKALKKGYKSFMKLMPSLLPIMLLMGILLVLVNKESIELVVGEDTGIVGVLLSGILGSIMFMPSFVAFTFGKGLLDAGAGLPQIAALVSGLMSVGIVSITIETAYFGKKFTILRNIFAFVLVLIFALVITIFINMGVIVWNWLKNIG